MDQLSADIVQTIADVIDHTDILSFRLTCRAFAAIGLPRQFETIPVMLFRNSLGNLRRISQHPVYRNYVLTIEFGPCVVSKPEGREDWIDAVKRRRRDPSEPLAYSELELEQAYQSHRRYYDDQEHMKVSGYSFETLKSAISCLPNLGGLRITPSNTKNESRFINPPPAWGVAFGSMAQVMSTAVGDWNQFWGFRDWNAARDITVILAAWKLAPRALSSFDCEVFDLELMGINRYGHMRGTVPPSRLNQFVEDPAKDIGLPLVCAMFENLTFLKLRISPTRGPNRGSWQQHLGAALRGAHGLQTLSIHHGTERHISSVPERFFAHPLNPYRCSFASLLGSSTWPNLTHLSLSSFAIRSTDLPPFFTRHPHLTHLTLGPTLALDFDWAPHLQSPSLAPHLRRMRSLTFTGTWRGGLWHEPFEDEDPSRFYYDEDKYLYGNKHAYDVPDQLEDTVDMSREFGKWAQRVAGARDLGELLKRWFAAGDGGARASPPPFPLRAMREVVDAVLREMGEGCWVHPDGGRNMWVAAERVVGEEYRRRDLYKDDFDLEDGKEVGESEVGRSGGREGGRERGEETGRRVRQKI